eukprot:3277497-Prymnesium_polylepis.1
MVMPCGHGLLRVDHINPRSCAALCVRCRLSRVWGLWSGAPVVSIRRLHDRSARVSANSRLNAYGFTALDAQLPGLVPGKAGPDKARKSQLPNKAVRPWNACCPVMTSAS